MIPVLLIAVPLLSGALSFLIKSERGARSWSLGASLLTLLVAVCALTLPGADPRLHADYTWMPLLGSSFSVGLDGMGKLLCLLTAVSYPLIFLAVWRRPYHLPHRFFGLMLLMQAGLLGVFLAMDALLFYFFWELALIPAYFLCSQWGGEKRIATTFKFFVYTFIGSLFMLLGIIYIYSQTAGQHFSLEAFYSVELSNSEQMWLFWIMFAAFAIKMPVFPLHTWQPDTYEQSDTAITMVLSGVMVKMGVFAVIRWLTPVLPIASWAWGDTVSTLAVVGMIYASLIALKQDDLKRLAAYSSISHVGLMCLAIFATNTMAMQGVMIQMFSHGIVILGFWIVIALIEDQFGTRKMSELGGIAQRAPGLAIALMVVSLANVGLPLTNSFIGEFMMFSGVFNSEVTKFNIVFAVAALVTIILSAVYTFNMLQKVLFGETSHATANGRDIRINEKTALAVIALLIVVIGVYPGPMLELTQSTVDTILSRMVSNHP